MKIITDQITNEELKFLAQELFGNMVKAVVDVEKEIVAVDAGLHADLEALLLEKGSKQNDLWGINLYPGSTEEDLVEFDSMINIKPLQNNNSRSVDSEVVRAKILVVVAKRIV